MPVLQRCCPDALWEQAQSAYAESRFMEAARLYSRLLRSLPRGSSEWYTCQLHRAHCLRLAGFFRRAAQLYRELSRVPIESDALTDTLVGQALALRALGQLRHARSLLEKALQDYRQRHDTEGIVHTLWALGTTLRFAGDFRTASTYLLEALALQRRFRLGSPTYLLCALGGLSRMRGAVQRSLAYYQRAHTWALREDDTFAIAYSACGIANAYRLLSDWDAAHHYFAIARLHYEMIQDRVSYAYTLWGEAMAHLLQHHWEQADELCTTAETLFRQTEDRRGLLHIVLLRLQFQTLHSARPSAERARVLRRALSWSRRYGYRFEELHLRLLGTLMGILPDSLHALRRAYSECGSRWLARLPALELPLNFP